MGDLLPKGAAMVPTEEDFEEEFFLEDFFEEEDSPSEEEKNPAVLTTRGMYSYEKDGSFRLSYEDTEITGLEGCITTFCLSPSGMLILLRSGEIRTCMVFEEGHRHLCDYGAESGMPAVVLQTHKLESEISESGGRIFVDYSVEIRGTLTERNEIFLSFEKERKQRKL
jgi:uncharacterized beta-barrel protein YwiB (DUF1934 family)